MIGIYKITNKANGKCYIGQSWDIHVRWSNHKLNSTKHPLYSSFKSYGVENFSFEVIREVSDGPLTQVLLNTLEIYYIKTFDSIHPKGYNLMSGGSNSRHCVETKKKIAESLRGRKQSDETKRKKAEACTGKKRSDETKRKISEALKGVPQSEEHRQKLSKARKGRNAWNKGKKASDEIRRRLSESHKGKRASDETRKKMSEARQRYLAEKKANHERLETTALDTTMDI